ncbi:LacI family DNA-binding transcriptional regulator [Gryllotalpicola ginsengisoli]|uniref:LacI family DNA-binding transcriptional regulator n=1 Tax=Gryllotalpicola ginsengisoli TaxID=444608 RepID=UPI0003B5E72F|nr:LacI family DNA-binding transcriptional regulator [Gryllotalpicola ginsengisoli]
MAATEPQRVRAPNMRDVAQLAGVSYQTVSRVVNNSPALRDETRERVLAAMEQLHYRPNRAARALKTSRSRMIGVLASVRATYGPALTIQAIESAAMAEGLYVSTAHITEVDTETISAAIDRLIDQDVEGLIVIAPQQRVFDTLAAMSDLPPTVTLRSGLDGDPRALWVDQMAGARAAVAHLAEQGHEYIRHLAGPQDWIEADARMQGYLLELSDRDLPTLPPIRGDWTSDFGYYAGRELMVVRDCTAFFCSNDEMAFGVMHAAHELGLDVPGDISVVGFDDVPSARHYWPPLTTVRQDFDELGRRCVRMLVDGTDASPGDVEPQLVVRASTAAPRRR